LRTTHFTSLSMDIEQQGPWANIYLDVFQVILALLIDDDDQKENKCAWNRLRTVCKNWSLLASKICPLYERELVTLRQYHNRDPTEVVEMIGSYFFEYWRFLHPNDIDDEQVDEEHIELMQHDEDHLFENLPEVWKIAYSDDLEDVDDEMSAVRRLTEQSMTPKDVAKLPSLFGIVLEWNSELIIPKIEELEGKDALTLMELRRLGYSVRILPVLARKRGCCSQERQIAPVTHKMLQFICETIDKDPDDTLTEEDYVDIGYNMRVLLSETARGYYGTELSGCGGNIDLHIMLSCDKSGLDFPEILQEEVDEFWTATAF